MAVHPQFTSRDVERFAQLALVCVHREYPNKISHILNGDADVLPPRELTPAFYGCFDWHSSVHGHWLLVRLLRLFPSAPFADRAMAALQQNLTAAKLAREAAYLSDRSRASFERPYGLAWLLQLCAELREWEAGRSLAANIVPLENVAVRRLTEWLPKLPFPVRSGEHSQTAFALGLMLDYARASGPVKFAELLESGAMRFYVEDRDAPLHFEPSGEDFLSPSLAEADVMRRIMSSGTFAEWLRKFLPQIPAGVTAGWLAPAISLDRTDGKLAHLDGLNLSRAWMLEGIAAGLPPQDPRLPAIKNAAAEHTRAGLGAVTGEHYEGGHWLGSFAVYLVTRRGLER